MGFWSTIAEKLKEVLQKMIGAKTIEKTLKVTPTISAQMENAIKLWTEMYKDEAYWLREPTYDKPVRIASMGLPSLIASEKARTALIEFSSEITTPIKTENSSNSVTVEGAAPKPTSDTKVSKAVKPEKEGATVDRATYLNEQYQNNLIEHLRIQLEYGIAKGGLIIKPYVVADSPNKKDKKKKTQYKIEFDFCQADCFYPLAFNSSGNITEAAFLDTVVHKDVIYRRLEYHKWENGSVKIINKAYKSTNSNIEENSGVDLGHEVPLTEVSEWADMEKEVTIDNVKKPLFGYFKMPVANTIDTKSPLGVSAYSGAVNLIKDADMQYSRLLWEYEGGELAIDVDRNAFDFYEDKDGKGGSVMPTLQKRLFRKVDVNLDGSTYEPYAPALRDASYINGLNTILMRIEDKVALSRGTLSDAAVEARTATELKILKQRSYQANADIQRATQKAIEDAIYAANVLCTLYQITPEGEYNISFEWDDSIITDVDTELNKRMTLMQNGLASRLENRMWYFGETENQAREALQKIEKENQEEMEQEVANSDFGSTNNKKEDNQNG